MNVNVDLLLESDFLKKMESDKTYDSFPSVSIVIPTMPSREIFLPLIEHNWERINYPKSTHSRKSNLELIIVCDKEKEKEKEKEKDKKTTKLKKYEKYEINTSKFYNKQNVRVYYCDKNLPIGKKRNLLASYANNEYIIHMDDDDWYYPNSVLIRVLILEFMKKDKNLIGCFGNRITDCYDLLSSQNFKSYDNIKEDENYTLGESTMAYSKIFWENQKWNDESKMAESIDFLKNRYDLIFTCDCSLITKQFSHGHNTVNRNVQKLSPDGNDDFIRQLDYSDLRVINEIKSKVILNIPEYKEVCGIIRNTKIRNDFLKIYPNLPNRIKMNNLIIQKYRNEYCKKNMSTGKDIVYYCGPGYYFDLRKKWIINDGIETDDRKLIVIYLCEELVKLGYNVTIYCSLNKELDFNGVKYRHYYKWAPKEIQDYLFIWRDPSNFFENYEIINCKNVFLDLYDIVDLSFIDSKKINNIKIIVKSNFHRNMILYKYKFNLGQIYLIESPCLVKSSQKLGDIICPCPPERCLSSLIKIAKRYTNYNFYWTYGFNTGVNCDPIYNKFMGDYYSNLKIELEACDNIKIVDPKNAGDYFKRGNIFIFPTFFIDVDCVDLNKCMHMGCVPVVPNNLVMNEKILGKYLEYVDCSNRDIIDYSLCDGDLEIFIKKLDKIINIRESNNYDKLIEYFEKLGEIYSKEIFINAFKSIV